MGKVSIIAVLGVALVGTSAQSAAAQTLDLHMGYRAHGKISQIPAREKEAYRKFVRLLLERKEPRLAYEDLAARSMVQHQPPFGRTRSSTIKQWQTMASLPSSRFVPISIRFAGNTAIVKFQGHLQPGQSGVIVTMRDRMRHGKIVEEWGKMQPLNDRQ